MPYIHPPWPALPALPEGLGDEDNLQHLLEQHRRYGIALRTRLMLHALERRKQEQLAFEQRLAQAAAQRKANHAQAAARRRAELQAQAGASSSARGKSSTPGGQPRNPQTTRERRVIERIEAMQGQAFGAWTVLSGFELAPENCTGGRFKRSKVNCQCGDCRRTRPVTISNLLTGRSQRCPSCAARKREQRSR